MTFTLKITLGNDAMQTTGQIAKALRTVADKIGPKWRVTPLPEEHKIMDLNGNTVGFWEVK